MAEDPSVTVLAPPAPEVTPKEAELAERLVVEPSAMVRVAGDEGLGPLPTSLEGEPKATAAKTEDPEAAEAKTEGPGAAEAKVKEAATGEDEEAEQAAPEQSKVEEPLRAAPVPLTNVLPLPPEVEDFRPGPSPSPPPHLFGEPPRPTSGRNQRKRGRPTSSVLPFVEAPRAGASPEVVVLASIFATREGTPLDLETPRRRRSFEPRRRTRTSRASWNRLKQAAHGTLPLGSGSSVYAVAGRSAPGESPASSLDDDADPDSDDQDSSDVDSADSGAPRRKGRDSVQARGGRGAGQTPSAGPGQATSQGYPGGLRALMQQHGHNQEALRVQLNRMAPEVRGEYLQQLRQHQEAVRQQQALQQQQQLGGYGAGREGFGGGAGYQAGYGRPGFGIAQPGYPGRPGFPPGPPKPEDSFAQPGYPQAAYGRGALGSPGMPSQPMNVQALLSMLQPGQRAQVQAMPPQEREAVLHRLHEQVLANGSYPAGQPQTRAAFPQQPQAYGVPGGQPGYGGPRPPPFGTAAGVAQPAYGVPPQQPSATPPGVSGLPVDPEALREFVQQLPPHVQQHIGQMPPQSQLQALVRLMQQREQVQGAQ